MTSRDGELVGLDAARACATLSHRTIDYRHLLATAAGGHPAALEVQQSDRLAVAHLPVRQKTGTPVETLSTFVSGWTVSETSSQPGRVSEM